MKPIALPMVHERFFPFFETVTAGGQGLRVLDVGAGHGAFTRTLHEAGHRVQACDLFPEEFRYPGVECRRADVTESLPYPDASFEVVVAIEVAEHVTGHEVFFRECARVLRPGGSLLMSTPNILSLMSRLRFLLSGFFYSFKPLDMDNTRGLQHVASLTLDQYRYMGRRCGLRLATVQVDRRQRSSRALLALYPALRLYCRLRGLDFGAHNQLDLLTGRVLFLQFVLSTPASALSPSGAPHPEERPDYS